mgnify:CR=1 FL=1
MRAVRKRNTGGGASMYESVGGVKLSAAGRTAVLFWLIARTSSRRERPGYFFY